jgi:hypothetical protein
VHVPFFSIPCIKSRAKFGDICSQAQYSHHYLPFGIHVSESPNDQRICFEVHIEFDTYSLLSHTWVETVKKATA